MKLNSTHIQILDIVRKNSMALNSLGGVADYEIMPFLKGIERTLKAMVKNGYLEQFITTKKVRFGSHLNPSGHILYRIAPEGAAALMRVAFQKENEHIEKRLAIHLAGVDPEVIAKTKELDSWRFNPYVLADEVELLEDKSNPPCERGDWG